MLRCMLNLVLLSLVVVGGNGQKNYYVVHLEDQVQSNDKAIGMHEHVLSKIKGSIDDARKAIVYSYTKCFNGFAAELAEEEAMALSEMDEVVAVIPNRYHRLATTKSWDFIGLPRTAKRHLGIEKNIVVGLLDTGITPESESFKDSGLGPPPAKWKGSCGPYANFSGCNNKLIGARYFKLDKKHDPADILSPVDAIGHGTHTASTLAGNIVENASLFGLAKGTARGAVPSARIAMYKVCWASSGCADMDILAGFEYAICDGVDLISVSIGGVAGNYTSDVLAIGAFHAMKNGITTVASAGNDRFLGSVGNHAPWIFTVAASGIDRDFKSKVVLGNGKSFLGVGINSFPPNSYPLVNGVDVPNGSERKENARFCEPESLDPRKVKGKLVYCELQQRGVESVIKEAGAAGTIMETSLFLDVAQVFMVPATIVNESLGYTITKYINQTRSPSAIIFKSQEIQIPAPFVASFSSRGPNQGTDRILKPDIAAPGVNILAAYSPLATVTGFKGDDRHSDYMLLSGTSMACPHVAGVVAYVKSFHPTWSPAAIRSAIMTSARPMSAKVNNDAEFAYGVGQLNPRRALNPGLVYDLDEMSYVQFLCSEGYTGKALATLVGSKSTNCSKLLPGQGYDSLNYPSMQLSMKNNNEPIIGTFQRTVTNVGHANSTYTSKIRAPKGVTISVKPTTLSFSHVGESKSFTVVVKANPVPLSTIILSGSLSWRRPHHNVRSPIVIYNPTALDFP